MAVIAALDPHVDAFQRRFLDAIAARPAPGPLFQEEVARLGRALPVGSSDGEPAVAQEQPACAHLPCAIAAGLAGAEAPLVAAVAALAPALCWTYGYPPDDRYPGLAERIAFCEVVGFRGLRPGGAVRLGLTLMAPGTAYPAHAHPAAETYLVISGTGLWQAGETPAAMRPPGSVIWHPADVPHAMTSFADPLLAVWSWSGRIAAPPFYTT
ncbi:dimethlysulfoniopropionate lyase [Stella humosa]|uniref:Dimethlysulfoniopropionate lyase n=1 Tax=Stella humosa TaxID=94 RepID=A0A3N1M9K1_9PROT|nr:dimethylsulfonioproprionate lyase family protein [Stella humosa]ROQ00351.1 dimethlysulfoniopropionate lyase [Stella humosa]BBK30410.1 transcriptional regulator [Stella humosa]